MTSRGQGPSWIGDNGHALSEPRLLRLAERLSGCGVRAVAPGEVRDPIHADTVTLRAPRTGNRGEWARTIACRILDGALALEEGDGYVSGPDAFSALGVALPEGAPANALARLSRAALQHAEDLRLTDEATLGARLYFFHRQPLTPHLVRRFPGDSDVLAFLGLQPGGVCRRVMGARWAVSSEPSGTAPWLAWHSVAPRPRGTRNAYAFKLYVSPSFDDVPRTLRILIDVLQDYRGLRFKVGSTVRDLLRPDKMLVYARDRATLRAVGEDLGKALNGVNPQGVPFTAPLADDALLSWGIDPPSTPGPGPDEPVSWRLWVTRKLAQYLTAARRTQGPRAGGLVAPWQFALARLELDGVDVARWRPTRYWRPALVIG